MRVLVYVDGIDTGSSQWRIKCKLGKNKSEMRRRKHVLKIMIGPWNMKFHMTKTRSTKWRLLGEDVEFKRHTGVAACLSQGFKVYLSKDLDKRCFIFTDPWYWWNASCCSIATIGKMLLEYECDETSEQALNQVQDVTDGRANLSHRLESIAMENHFPLNSSFGWEKRAGVNRKLEFHPGTGR